MDSSKKYKLMDLIDDIKEVDEMIKVHTNDNSAMMLDQYKAKNDKLIGYLIDELIDPEFRSPKSMFIIKILIERFYPNLVLDAKQDVSHKDLNDIEAVLV